MKPDPATLIRDWCREQGFPEPVQEYRFAAPVRDWAFDFAWLEQRVALEIEGGVWTGGRHTRPTGFLGDVEKYNIAAIMGWRTIRATPKQVHNGQALGWLYRILKVTHDPS